MLKNINIIVVVVIRTGMALRALGNNYFPYSRHTKNGVYVFIGTAKPEQCEDIPTPTLLITKLIIDSRVEAKKSMRPVFVLR